MGYDGAAPQRRVELLMSDYFRRVRPVARALSASREALEPAPPDAALLRRIGRHLEIAVDGVRFVDPARVASMPAMWVEAFRVALANDCGVSEQARTCIEAERRRVHGRRFRGNRRRPSTGAQPVRAAAGPLPSSLRDARLRAAVLHVPGVRPDSLAGWCGTSTIATRSTSTRSWRSATSSRCAVAASPARERFGGDAVARCTRPELLTLALLYHDVGKWREADHAAESVRLVQPMLERLQLSPEARQTVTFLIRQHLAMSRAAFLRDSEDPEVVSALRGARADRRAAQDAVPAHARRHRRGQPRDADALEGRAPVASLRGHLQPPHVRIRRRADSDRSRRPRRRGGRAAGGHLRSASCGRFSTVCRAATSRCSGWRRSTATCGSPATSIPTRSTPLSRSTRTSGSCPS